jgi:hypothetical protein
MLTFSARMTLKSKCKNNVGQLYSIFRGSSGHDRASYHLSHLYGRSSGYNDDETSSGSAPSVRVGKPLDKSKMNGMFHQATFSRSISNTLFECAGNASLTKYQTVRLKSTVPNDSSKVENQAKQTVSSQVADSDSLTKENKNVKGSFVGLFQKYGWTFFGTYMSIYVTTLVSLYASIDTGLLDPTTIANIDLPWHAPSGTAAQDADVREFHSTAEFVGSYLEKFSWTKQYASYATQNPHTTNLALAWIATKLTEPIRLAVTLAILPSVSKMVGKKGDQSVADTTDKKMNDSKQ